MSGPRHAELVGLIGEYPSMCVDVTSRTNVLWHDIGVGVAKPIRQRFYRVNPAKRKFLDAEVSYVR